MDSKVPHITHQALHPDPSTSEWGPEEFEEGLWVDYISLAIFQTSLVNATPHPAKDPKLNVQSSAWQDRAVASRGSTWRFMGSYKWGEKSPYMAYNNPIYSYPWTSK